MANIDELKNEFGEASEYKHKHKITAEEAEAAKKAAQAKDEALSKKKKRKTKLRMVKRKVTKTVDSVLEDKTLGKIFNLYFVCFAVHILEYAIVINYFRVNTRGFIGNFVCLCIIFIYLYSMRLKPSNIGLAPSKKLIKKSIKTALVFNITILPVVLVEILIYFINDIEIKVRFFAYNMSYSASGGFLKYVFFIFYLFLISLVGSLALEALFRGLMLKTGKGKFGFWQTTILVSILYSLWFVIIPLTKLFTGIGFLNIFGLFIFYAIYEFIVAVKWSLCTRASGSLWLAFFDHLIFTFMMNFYHVIDQTEGCEIPIDQFKQTRLLAIQIISFVIVFLYYQKKMKKKKEIAASRGGHSSYFDSLADLSEDEISNKVERSVLKTNEGEIDAEYLKMLERRQAEEAAKAEKSQTK